MCLIRLIKFLLKFVLPVAIIALIVYLVYFNSNETNGVASEAIIYFNMIL